MIENNIYEVHYQAARIARIMMIFDPVELIDDDLIYNGGGGSGDADNLPDPDVNSNQELIPPPPSGLNKDDEPLYGGSDAASSHGMFVKAVLYLQRIFIPASSSNQQSQRLTDQNWEAHQSHEPSRSRSSSVNSVPTNRAAQGQPGS